MNSYLLIFLVAAFGSSLQEILHWYRLRKKLHHKRYDNLIRSHRYWLVTSLMVIGSGLAVVVWTLDSETRDLKTVLVLGASFPLILKRAVEAAEKTALGDETDGYFS